MENLKKAMIIRNGNVVGAVGDKNFSTAPIGTVLAYAGNEAPRGYLLADGASYSTAEYPDLYAVIGNTYGGDSTNFNVPNLVDKFIQGSTTSGEEKEAGLPNITGTFYHDTNVTSSLSGAFFSYTRGNSQNLKNDDGNKKSGYVSFDASKSNAIYGNSNTVQPPALTMAYIIKAFHTNEGQDEGVSDSVINYVDGKIIDTTTSTDTVWSSKKTSDKIDEKYGAYTFDTEGAIQWLKLTLGGSSKCQPIVISDQFGGKVEITGMNGGGVYKTVKLVRYSYGDWTTYSATDYTTTTEGDANYKIRRLFYYPAGSCYYLEIGQYCTIKVSGAIDMPEIVASLPAETSAMTLIEESNWGAIDDSKTSTTSTWSSSKINSKLGGLSFSTSGTTLTITNGTNTWTLVANS